VSRPPPSAAARDEFEEAFEGYGEGFENDAGDAIASSRSRALSFPRRLLLGLRRVSRQIMPLMEFPDDALEKRFNQWHRRAMLRVDLTRAAISCCTSLLWYQKFRMYTTSSAASFLPLHAMTYLFAVNLFQVYFLLGHPQTYLRVRNAALTFGKLNMAATFFVTRAALAAANAAILVQHYESYPRLAAPEGELSALRAWLAETAWLVPAYVPEPSAGPEMPDLLVVSIEVKVFAVLLQFFGTHQLMRTNVNIALFTVFSACVLEPAVFSQPPDAALPIRSKLFPSIHKFTRLTNIFVDLSFLFLTGYLAERHLRASFAKEINLEMRQAEFMRSPLARLRMTVAPFPPGAPRTAAGEDWDPSPRTRQISAAEQERRGVEGETEWEADTGGGASAGGRGRGRGGREATTSARLRPDERLRRRSRARNGRGDA
jgi:hypothetical protein